MKVIAIPDIHGSHHWEKVVSLINTVDKVVFLGDEFDTWTNIWPDQIINALNIIDFKKKFSDKVCLCWSNHATSYYLDESCSGYQHQHSFDIKEFYEKHRNLYEVCHIFDNYIFVHGGISYKWMRLTGIKEPSEVNQLFKERPNFFRWCGPNGYGDNKGEGPLWIRPGSLIQTAAAPYNYVIGHTESNDHPKEYQILQKNDHDRKIIAIDTKQHDRLIKIDTLTGFWKLI